jgi:pyruvate dehydrogenase E2 component (dihydrolipoamide acetyltransferase)
VAKESVIIPDLGSDDEVDVIELSVKPGDIITVDQSLVVLESAKASMEVPSSLAGRCWN